MNNQQFAALAQQGYNCIPLSRQILADLDTPLSTYLKLANFPFSYLFESVQGGEKWGRYSIIGLPCNTVIQVFGNTINVHVGGELTEQVETQDPLQWIESYHRQFKTPDLPGLPRFTGGLVGYFGYDTIRYIEPRLSHCPNPDTLQTPDIFLMLSEEVVVFDNLSGKLMLVVYVDPRQDGAFEQGERRLDELTDKLSQSIHHVVSTKPPQTVRESDFLSGFTQSGFEQAVKQAKHYIVEGDVMQVVLSQRLSIPFSGNSLDLYRALRCLNPSPYMYYINAGDFYIVGSSPEILVREENGDVTVRPIAGTRPRGATELEDLELEKELLADPKEVAEHLMLIDLGRNDVGRIAEVGSVKVTERMLIERYSHVMHIVSNVVCSARHFPPAL